MGTGNKPLDLQWLEDFAALCETGNFSRAAVMRSIAQPALSRHIKSLEEWVGVDLIDRTAHPVELTAAGHRFRPLIEDVMSSLEAARIKARLAQDQAWARLRFACTHALSLTFFPHWLSGLEAHGPLGAIQTITDSFQACEDLMHQRKVQFLLCHAHDSVKSRLDHANYPVRVLSQEFLIPVCATNAQGKPQHPMETDGLLPMLEYSETSGLGRILKAALAPEWEKWMKKQSRTTHSVVFSAPHSFLLKAMALAGKGIAWLPQSLVMNELDQGSLILAAGEDWHVPVEIRLYRQKSELTPIAESVWNRVQA